MFIIFTQGGIAVAAFLYCVSGPYEGQEFELDQSGIIIGRDSTCSNIILESATISRKHARVFETTDGRVGVEDLNSSNGTFIKNAAGRKKISGIRTLDNGDRLIIGQDEAFVFEARSPEPSIDEAVTRKISPGYAEVIKNKAQEIKDAMPENLKAPNLNPEGGLYNEPVQVTEAMLASPLQRLGARLVDGAMCSIIMALVFFFAGVSLLASAFNPSGALSTIAIGYLAYIGVNIYFLCTAGQTIGKKLMGVRIARLDGRKASFWAVIFIRMLAFFILTIIPFIGWAIALIDICFIFRSDRRMLHDLLAGTVVLKVPSKF